MSQTLLPGSIVAMTDQAADRLLRADSGDAALYARRLCTWLAELRPCGTNNLPRF